MIHNFDSLKFSYNNVPWGGVRTSVLRDALVAPGSGENAEQIYPIPGWGASDMYLQNLKTLGGYTIFTQGIRTPVEEFAMPCFDASTGDSVACTHSNAESLRLVSMGQSPTESSGHTSSWGMTTLRMKVESTFTSAEGCKFTSPHTLICKKKKKNTRSNTQVAATALWCFETHVRTRR